jgi:DNA-binding MarR family transcriptional regulator
MTQTTPSRRRGRQLPTAEQLRIWRDFIETAEALRAELATRLQKDCSLSPGDYAVLLALTETPERELRSSEIADAIDWERSRVSHHLGRMERRGLIQRTDCPGDNRGALVVLTDDGYQAIRRASGPHLRAVKRLFADALDPAQIDDLGGVLTSLRDHLASTTEGHRS